METAHGPVLQLIELELENYWGIEKSRFVFHKDLTVLIGKNGSGKTSVLDALAKAFRLMEANLRSGDTKVDPAQFFLDTDIHNQASEATIRIKASLDFDPQPNLSEALESGRSYGKPRTRRHEAPTELNGTLDWAYSLDRGGFKKVARDSSLEGLYRFVEYINLLLRSDDPAQKVQASLPFAVFYPCSRASDISLCQPSAEAKPVRKQTSLFDAWTDALTEDSFAYMEFFRWFRQAYGKAQQGESSSREKAIFDAVCQAIYEMFGDGNYFEKLSFSWAATEGEILIRKRHGPDIRLSQLSAGERVLLLMAADLARRLVIANPNSDKPLEEGSAIVMIDEIGLHLHPEGQRNVIPSLRKTFPKVQFIVTTHSPQVLQNVEREHLRILADGKVLEYQPYIQGRDANSILTDAFGLRKRLDDYEEKVSEIYRLMDEDKLTEAEDKLNKLKQQWGADDLEINRMQNYLELYSG